MKHQNRIAQRIITAAKRSGKLVYASPEFKIHGDLTTEILNRLGADIREITLSAVVYMDKGDIDTVQILAKTSTLRKQLNFHVGTVEELGEQIAWMIEQLEQGNGQNIKTPEDNWTDYQENQQHKNDYDIEDWLDDAW